ncbi:hypothetical protein AXG93_2912s1500 [Marchantia polymorpha subsp. ruderalis]|uniref:Retrovirus-related Pol polyprotein from transposon TNT 1-94-like beta-barrel domain-containing protein n=1 Tax=Marchantia polymorpha subsp. ruderalis TaxID=1480154 RepID=A0A176WG13_MARPO|nr:hypothetical protein AXG93_2912s1500 [Marchantia polymorpha subsp. ruderalis]
MIVEEVTERLRAVEYRLEARKLTTEMNSRLVLFTKKEEMIRCMRQREKETAAKGNPCRYCKKYGRWEQDCRKKKRDEAANLVKAQGDEEDEPALMMVHVASIISPTHDEMVTADGQVYLNKDRATVQIGDTSKLEQARKMWYLDKGAANHMIRNIAVFSELNRGITDTVKFGDGSLVDILGRVTIIFSARRESYRVLTKVYYIPRLHSNTISRD